MKFVCPEIKALLWTNQKAEILHSYQKCRQTYEEIENIKFFKSKGKIKRDKIPFFAHLKNSRFQVNEFLNSNITIFFFFSYEEIKILEF